MQKAIVPHNKNKQRMKRFNLRGHSANWEALKVEALNTKTEEYETRSDIKHGYRVTVHVVNNFYRVYDKKVHQILHGEISDEDNLKIIHRIAKAKRPDFILFHEGKVVGFANYHRRGWLRRLQEQPKLKTFHLEVGLTAKVDVEAYSREEAEQQVYEAVEQANNLREEGELNSEFEVSFIIEQS